MDLREGGPASRGAEQQESAAATSGNTSRLLSQHVYPYPWRNVVVGPQGQLVVLEVPPNLHSQHGGSLQVLNMQPHHLTMMQAPDFGPPPPHAVLHPMTQPDRQQQQQQPVALKSEFVGPIDGPSAQHQPTAPEAGQHLHHPFPLTSLLAPASVAGMHVAHVEMLGGDPSHLRFNQEQLGMLLSRDQRAQLGLPHHSTLAPPGIMNYLRSSSAAAAAAAPSFATSHQPSAGLSHFALAGDAAWTPSPMLSYAPQPLPLDVMDTTALHRRPSLREDEPSMPSSHSTGRLSSRSTGRSDKSDSKRSRGKATSTEDVSTGGLSPSRKKPRTRGLGASPTADKKSGASDLKSDKEKNRQAQQRFRERQKVMINKLQEEVNMLHRKLAEAISRIWFLEKENSAMQDKLQLYEGNARGWRAPAPSDPSPGP